MTSQEILDLWEAWKGEHLHWYQRTNPTHIARFYLERCEGSGWTNAEVVQLVTDYERSL